jgi:hypothetical protein
MPVIVVPKEFLGCLNKFERKGRSEAKKLKEAMVDAQIHGKINLSPRPESRIPHVEKYTVSDGDRLVVQLIGQVHKARAFLFAGTHDETEAWLDSHKGYKWVARESDSKLEFVQVSESLPPVAVRPEKPEEAPSGKDATDEDPSVSSTAQSGPLLGFLETDNWGGLAIRNETKEFLKTVDLQFLLTREEEILERLPALEPEKRANLLYDLLCHASKGEFDAFNQRLALHKDEARVVEGTELVAAALEPANSESLITFDDGNVFRDFMESGGTLAEWMFFLHPSQKELVDRDFNGPARLRGVSGSGKTCVLVHRARRLARLYKEPVLIVTLTESMRKLLDNLLDDLCGVERTLVSTATVASTIRHIVDQAFNFQRAVNRVSEDALEDILAKSVDVIRKHPGFREAQFGRLPPSELHRFVREEFAYVRTRLIKADYGRYLDATAFPRRGRGFALPRQPREAVLEGLFSFEAELEALKAADSEALVQFARGAVIHRHFTGTAVRSVLIDEVQDLSQLELETIANLKTPAGEPVRTAQNALFLVGDGTQTIYRRGFRLATAGIQVTGRSYHLRKNYRNTYEVLRAAHALVSNFEFADSDESEFARPTPPDFASRHGVIPALVKCRSTEEEAKYVVASISTLCTMSLTPGQIAVIGCNQTVRDSIRNLLAETQIPFVELREDVRADSDRVKISTIESAKGHEFHTVFIAGLVDGVIPPRGTVDAELAREASRLYVAMTRARDELHLSYSPTRDFPASRFLMQVADHCEECALVNGALRAI